MNLSDMKNIDSSGMHSLIVPVWLHHRNDTNNRLLTYALLDEQSDACFVKIRREWTRNRAEVVNSPSREAG